MPKQSFLPSWFGVNAFGTTNRDAPSFETFTITNAEDIQPNSFVPETLYVVVVSGDATGFAMFALSRLSAGDHVYSFAPDTSSWVTGEVQFTSFNFRTDNTGIGFTVTCTCMVVSNAHTVSRIFTAYNSLAGGMNVTDGKKKYDVRFSADLKTNSAIVFRRKRKE